MESVLSRADILDWKNLGHVKITAKSGQIVANLGFVGMVTPLTKLVYLSDLFLEGSIIIIGLKIFGTIVFGTNPTIQ